MDQGTSSAQNLCGATQNITVNRFFWFEAIYLIIADSVPSPEFINHTFVAYLSLKLKGKLRDNYYHVDFLRIKSQHPLFSTPDD